MSRAKPPDRLAFCVCAHPDPNNRPPPSATQVTGAASVLGKATVRMLLENDFRVRDAPSVRPRMRPSNPSNSAPARRS